MQEPSPLPFLKFFSTQQRFYHVDGTGIHPRLHGTNRISPKDRSYYLTRIIPSVAPMILGLKHPGNRFGALLTSHIHHLDLYTNWINHGNLLTFIRKFLAPQKAEGLACFCVRELRGVFYRVWWSRSILWLFLEVISSGILAQDWLLWRGYSCFPGSRLDQGMRDPIMPLDSALQSPTLTDLTEEC